MRRKLQAAVRLAAFFVIPVIKAFAGFLAEFSLGHQTPQNVRRAKRLRTELAKKILGNIQPDIEADIKADLTSLGGNIHYLQKSSDLDPVVDKIREITSGHASAARN